MKVGVSAFTLQLQSANV